MVNPNIAEGPLNHGPPSIAIPSVRRLLNIQLANVSRPLDRVPWSASVGRLETTKLQMDGLDGGFRHTQGH
jgi:hypothetical protein